MLLNQELNLVNAVWAQEFLTRFPLARSGLIQEVKQTILILVFYLAASHLYSHFSEQNREFLLFFLFLLLLIFFSVLPVPESGQDGGRVLVWAVLSTLLTKSFAHRRSPATSLEPAQAPEQTLLKTAFAKAKPAENAIAKTSKRILQIPVGLADLPLAWRAAALCSVFSQMQSPSSAHARGAAGDPLAHSSQAEE